MANRGFVLLTFGVVCFLTLPVLVQEGMFMDAMLYSSVAHNLSQGVGTFWFPEFPYHNWDGVVGFHDQPPLVFGIQALFYHVLGSSIYVERLYVFLCLAANIFLIVQIHQTVAPSEHRRLWWVPVLLYITVPVVYWSYQNNMHENTLSFFTLLAVLPCVRAMNGVKPVLNAILSGACIVAAVLSKGVPGFFPLAVPFLTWVGRYRIPFPRIARTQLLMLAVVAFAGIVLIIYPPANESLSIYIHQRLLYRLAEAPLVADRTFTLVRLALELLPPLILSGLLLLALKQGSNGKRVDWRSALFMVLIGAAASLPLMLTSVQRGFYLVPSFPYFALALAIVLGPSIDTLLERVQPQRRLVLWSGWTVLGASLLVTVLMVGRTYRNPELLEDVYAIGGVVPEQSDVTIPHDLRDTWGPRTYLMRYFMIGTDVDAFHTFYLCRKGTSAEIPEGYQEVPIQLNDFKLYKSIHASTSY